MQPDPPKSLTQYNFKTALIDFQHLKQQNTLPLKMAIKLQYLQNKILGRPIVIQEYKQLPEYELQSLQQCDKQSQTMLFVSIVKCLSGKQVIVYFTNAKAYIKKQQTFSIWNKCYLSCDSAYLYVKKKATKKTNYYEFKIRLLKVSKKYLEYKGRLCFGIMYEDKKYMLGFEQETACERIFKTLKQLVKENQPERIQKKVFSNVKSQQLLYEKSQKNEKQELVSSQTQQSSQNVKKQLSQNNLSLKYGANIQQSKLSLGISQKSGSVLEFEQDDLHEEINLKEVKEAEISEAIKQEIKRQNIASDSNFKLVKNFDMGRLLVYNGPNQDQMKQAKTKTSMILSLRESKIDYSWLLEQYLSMKSWNLEIEQSKIIHKISQNSFKVYLQFKRYSMLSLTRWAIVIATGIVADKKVYMVIRSCEELTEEEMVLGNYMSTVRMKKFDQTVQMCQRCQTDDKVLMTIITSADFGGYCSKTDNLNMSLYILNNVQNFYNFLVSQAIAKDYDEGKIPLFELNSVFPQTQMQTPTKSQSRFTESSMSRSQISTIPKRKHTFNSSEMSDEDVDNVFEQEEKPIKFEKKKSKLMMKSEESFPEIKVVYPSSKQVEEMLFKEFVKQFETFQVTDRGTQKLVSFIESKIQQRYYLKHKFIQHHSYDANALKYNNEQVSDNWLIQKGKWRISGLQLIFTNEQILAQQKNVIKLILKQLSSNVMAGKNIMNMSLPVEIFENKSFLQKLGQVYGLFPHYFNIAAKQKNIAKQITYVTQAIAYATTICPNIEKPFNPIIGETYQCNVGGVSLCFEQISHHPPISSFYFNTEEYECYGNHNPLVEMGLNTAVARNINPVFVNFFQTNTKYTGYGQDFQIGGLLFGQRTYKNSGRVNVFEEKNQILCQLSYGKNKKNIYESSKKLKTGEIIGGVYKVSNNFSKRFRNVQWKTFDGIKYDQKIQELAKITGNWMGDFFVDNVKLRGMYDIVPCKPVKQTVVLASDCSFRLDVFYKKMGDNKKSQEWKEVMENLQRKDKKLREQNDKQQPQKH